MPPPLPSAGYVQLNLEGGLALNISIAVIRSCCTRPLLYLQYVGWCILKAIGELQDSEGNAVDLDTEDIDEEMIYNYQTDTGLEHAIDPEVIRLHSSVATTKTDIRANFKQLLSERDGNCIWTNEELPDGTHLIPFARGDEWLQRIVENRFHEGDDEEDLTDIHINDIRNGVLGSRTIHGLFDRRDVAVLKTPNPILQCHHIPAMHQRELPEGASYPQGSRYTLQWLTTGYNVTTRSRYPHNSDAAFIDHSLPKPSELILHYMYGAAMLQQFGLGGYEELLLTRAGVPRPEPPPRVPTPPTRTVGDRSRTIAKLEQARQRQGGGGGNNKAGRVWTARWKTQRSLWIKNPSTQKG
ncbi:hypothetical protein Clacol_001977 [Clathrus columnatus]|uniref:HNH nuclease domain-containing protein n=1 Tax=Clathrus columnatus TaxID=1419009 RepID=A0AAV4ZZH9_9AGAM|nr:hypothetical protein Clacol_001977 [Clathrus columnatus]